MAEKDGLLKVVISKDKLQAYISTPQKLVQLDKKAIYQALEAAGVVYGIKGDAVESFARNPQVGKVMVAEGIPPQPGVDERVELLFSTETQSHLLTELNRVDFRETSTIVSVEPGTVLAIKHPAIPGQEGKGVNGQILPPPPPKSVELRAGKGVEIQDEGRRAVAMVNGRPWVKETATACIVNVDPVLVWTSDVCIKSGNIRFKGDVRILGNVCEAMEVQATGNIEIMGLVTRAEVISGGKLVIQGGVIGSKLRAGRHFFPEAKKISFYLQDIKNNLELIDQALEQLKTQQGFDFQEANFGRVVMALLDTRFKDLRTLVKNFVSEVNAIRNMQLPEEIVNCVRSLSCLAGLNPLTMESFNEILQNVDLALELLQQEGSASPADVLIHSSMLSNIQSSGSVYVTRQGCVNTVINAGGNVVIKGSFKGGEIFCEGSVEIQELGSTLGVPPVVRTGTIGQIKVARAFAGAVVQVGNQRMVLTENMGAFKACLSKEGELIISQIRY